MILRALADYYERLLTDSKSGIAPPGWFWGKLDFAIVIDLKGTYCGLDVLYTQKEKRRISRPTLLPYIGKQAVKHTNSGTDANLFWDNSSFVLGIDKNAKKLESFINVIKDFSVNIEDKTAIQSVLNFLEARKFDQLFSDQEYGELLKSGSVSITFRLYNNENIFIFNRKEIEQAISKFVLRGNHRLGCCLVSGLSKQPIEEYQPVIKHMYGVQKDPNFISFNKKSFNSFGKEQGENAPISKKVTFAYFTALNYLLREQSKQRVRVGDASTVFWAKASNALEDDFSWILGEPPKGEESVSYEKIRALLAAVKTGVLPAEDNTSFYILGLSPNASRISVRFWYEGSVKDLKQKIAQHFEDIDIVKAPHDREYLSLFRLLLAIAAENKAANIPPNLAGEMVRAILLGLPYPRALLSGALRRCKAEQRVTHARASIIKGFLTRNARFRHMKEKEVAMSLDSENTNIGYVLGRCFAVLERIQEQAQGGGLNKTIRDTYFGAACSSPRVIFKRLQDLSIHHLSKMRKAGKNTVWLDKLMGEIMDKIPAEGIPATLNLEDQSRFAIGYYHQRQDFFTKRDNNSTKEGGE